ncbi:hypothetical protein Tco_0219163 [Tanacetum coccineum]
MLDPRTFKNCWLGASIQEGLLLRVSPWPFSRRYLCGLVKRRGYFAMYSMRPELEGKTIESLIGERLSQLDLMHIKEPLVRTKENRIDDSLLKALCHEKVVRIPLEGDEILQVHGESTQGVVKTLMNIKTDQVSSFSSYTRRFQEVKLAMIYIDEINARNGILILKDIMRACVIDFGGSYHLSIQCAPFEALYGRKCRSPALWAEIGGSSLTGLELVQGPNDKVVLVKEKPKAARDRQKSDFDYRRPFEILERISLVTYRLRLPKELNSVHDTFHVSNLKKCMAYANLHVPLDEIKVDKTLRFVEEPVEIMDREIKKLKRKKIALVKVRWNSKRGPEFTWEHEDQMRIKYPQLFVDRVVEPAS